ncbi:MAG: YfhO family protein [Chloroflexi bacterium]|nr:YfhO family protein [Chloroflexota bacterium]MCL5074473.1 YfhO family protein [Chloroflexota bacterium]
MDLLDQAAAEIGKRHSGKYGRVYSLAMRVGMRGVRGLAQGIMRRARFGWQSEMRGDVGAIAFLFCAVLFLFREAILAGKIYYESDTVTFYFPLAMRVDQAFAQGRIPLWTPNMLAGFPLFADGETGILYPLNLLLFAILPAVQGFVWQRVIHFFLAGCFTYAYARLLDLSRSAAMVAALVFTLGSFMVAQMHHANVVNSATWLPLILFFLEKGLCSRGKRFYLYLTLAGVALGVESLAVHVQPVLLTSLAIALYVAFRVLLASGITVEMRSFGPLVRTGVVRSLLLLQVLFLVFTIGLGLAAVQLLPLYELSRYSFRGYRAAWEFATSFSLPMQNILTLLFPYFFRGPHGENWSPWVHWETTVYAGIAPLILASLAVIWVRNRYVLFFGVLALLSLLLAFGGYLPIKLYWLVWRVPVLSMMRVPGRFSLLFILSVAILAGFGLDWLRKRALSHGSSASASSLTQVRRDRFGLYLAVLAACLGGIGLLLSSGRAWLVTNRELALALIQRFYLAQDRGNATLTAEQAYDFLLHSLDLSNPRTIVSLVLLLLTVLTLFCFQRFTIAPWLGQGLLVLLVAGDLLYFASGFHPMISIERLVTPSAAIDFMREGAGLYRVYTWRHVELESNKLTQFGLAQFGGYSSLRMDRHRIYTVHAQRAGNRLLDLANVRYVQAAKDTSSSALSRYRPVFQDGENMVYENPNYLPRAFLVPSVKIIKPGPGVMRRMMESDFDPAKEAILEEPFDLTRLMVPDKVSTLGVSPDVSLMGSTEVVHYSPQRVLLRVQAARNALLVLTDAYYPGWKAFVGGKRTKIYRADYLFRAVYVPQGDHTVEFVFDPFMVKLGLLISAITAILLLLFWLTVIYESHLTKAALHLILKKDTRGSPEAVLPHGGE